MKKHGLSTALVACVAFIATYSVYGQAEFADVGVTLLPAKAVTYGAPGVASVIWMLFKMGFPSFGGSIDKILKLLSFGKVGMLETTPKTSHNLLSLLNQLEVEAASLGIPTPGTQPVRTAALLKLAPPAEPAKAPETAKS